LNSLPQGKNLRFIQKQNLQEQNKADYSSISNATAYNLFDFSKFVVTFSDEWLNNNRRGLFTTTIKELLNQTGNFCKNHEINQAVFQRFCYNICKG
jgi:hypothetical protein